jgi:hypothetical protein
MKKITQIILDHDEAKAINHWLESNLAHPAHNETLKAIQFHNKIIEITGSGRHGTLEGALVDFYDKFFAAEIDLLNEEKKKLLLEGRIK